MSIPVNNFRLVSVTKDAPPELEKYCEIKDYQIYHSLFNLDIYVLYDSKFEVYRSLEFVGANKRELDKNLNIYINSYYISLPDVDKSTTSR